MDYFDILVEDRIGTIPAQTSIDKCLATGNSTFCNLIERDPIMGSLWVSPGRIITTNTNVAETSTSGFDIIFDYVLETGIGPIGLKGISTIVDSDTLIVLPGEPELECAGKYGSSCGKNPVPEFSGNYSAELSRGDFDYNLGLRYLGETDTLNSDNIDFEAKTYIDATVKYTLNENISFSMGASNIFDEDPVYTSSAGTAPGNGNTFPGYFDALGTYVFLNISVQY